MDDPYTLDENDLRFHGRMEINIYREDAVWIADITGQAPEDALVTVDIKHLSLVGELDVVLERLKAAVGLLEEARAHPERWGLLPPRRHRTGHRGPFVDRPSTQKPERPNVYDDHELQPILRTATDEARKLQHQWVGTEHHLIALIAQRDSGDLQWPAAEAITVDEVRGKVAERVGRGQVEPAGHMPLTETARRCVRSALAAARRERRAASSADLLRSLLNQETATAQEIIAGLGIPGTSPQ